MIIQAEIGLVYNPILDDMYTARRGQGAFCNGKKLKCTKTKGTEIRTLS